MVGGDDSIGGTPKAIQYWLKYIFLGYEECKMILPLKDIEARLFCIVSLNLELRKMY